MNHVIQVRKGVLPRLLDEILSTRIMVKQAMKKLSSSQQVLHRVRCVIEYKVCVVPLSSQH